MSSAARVADAPSRDVRVRDGPHEMVECTRKADLECCVPCIKIFRAHLPSILVTIIYMHESPLAHELRKMGRVAYANGILRSTTVQGALPIPSRAFARHFSDITRHWRCLAANLKAPEKGGPRSSRRWGNTDE